MSNEEKKINLAVGGKVGSQYILRHGTSFLFGCSARSGIKRKSRPAFSAPFEALAKPPATLRLTACLAGRPAG